MTTTPARGALCECGCGQYAGVYPRTVSRYGMVKGAPKRFLTGHHRPNTRNRLCDIAGCGRTHWGHGLCRRHRRAQAAHGDPLWTPPTDAERFWTSVDTSGDCWLWTGAIARTGYGVFGIGGRTVLAHRYAFEDHVALIPENLEIDHLCRVRHCVNPQHLEPVTSAENARRGLNGVLHVRIEQCVNGHDYTPANTYLAPDGARDCRACRRDRNRRYKARRRSTHGRTDSGGDAV